MAVEDTNTALLSPPMSETSNEEMFQHIFRRAFGATLHAKQILFKGPRRYKHGLVVSSHFRRCA
jgi:hypothetical protein